MLIVCRNELAITSPSERETAGKCTATIWSSLRVKRSVFNPKSVSNNYAFSRDEGGINSKSATTTEKLEAFACQLERSSSKKLSIMCLKRR